VAKFTGNFWSSSAADTVIAAIDSATIDSGTAISRVYAAISSALTSSFSYYSPAPTSSSISAYLTNGDHLLIAGSHLTSYPITITGLNYHSVLGNLDINCTGSVSVAKSSASPSGYISQLYVSDGMSSLTINGKVNIRGIAGSTFSSIAIGYGPAVVTVGGDFQYSTTLGTMTGTVKELTISSGDSSLSVSNFSIPMSTFDGFNTATEFLASVFSGNDTINGSAGHDWLPGYAGNDTVTGGGDTDSMDGGEGSDLYIIALAADHTAAEICDTGGSGTDEVRFTSTVASTLILYEGDVGIETVVIGTGIGATAVTTAATALNVDAALVTTALSITGNAGNNSLTGGLGNDTLVGGKGNDTFIVVAGIDTITDLGKGGADVLTVSSGATANATVTAAWTATSASTTAGAVNITTSGFAVNLAAATGTGYVVTNIGGGTALTGSSSSDGLTGGVGKDTLVGSAGNDTLMGGKGADSLTGGSGTDTFVFTTGDSGQTASFDIIRDYFKGAVGTGDLIDFSANLTIGGSAATATANQAAINQDTGIATFAAGSGKKLGDALLDIATRFTAATNTSGEFSFFKVNNTGDYYLYISDGVAGVTANDDVIQLVGVSSISGIDFTSGNLTITG
jgi:Ca2+-binding RTX toxin-like protein